MSDAARALFHALTGREPEGIWSAPGRVNLIGEHTDYNDGFVLPFAIEHRTSAAAALRADRNVRVVSTLTRETVEVSLDELGALFPARTSPESRRTPRVPEWAAYVLGVLWALDFGPERCSHGVDFAIASNVPVGAGLSSSAALEGAVATALNELFALDLDALTLAQAGRRAENEAVGAPTGIMDQLASLLGHADAASFIDCRSLEVRSVPTGFEANGLTVLVVDTRVQHTHATGGYRARREACERGAARLGVAALRDVTPADLARAQTLMSETDVRRVRHVVTENQRVLDTVAALEQHGPRAIGALLTASHASMRDDFEISVPELDLAVDTCLAGGALGARMTGGGFGGSAIALIDRDRVDGATPALRQAYASAGYADPHIFTVRPSAGPRRDA